MAAKEETSRLLEAFGGSIFAVHHIGSTSIPGIHAKPIVDLLPVARSLSDLDEKEGVFLQLGYQFWGEYGIPGRRYSTFDDLADGRRKFQLHCFEEGSPEIERHLAFRDFLRANPKVAQEYDDEKHRCRELHSDDSHAYSDAKADWIARHLVKALDHFRTAG